MSEEANEQAQQAGAREQAQQAEISQRLLPIYDPDLDAIEMSHKHLTLSPDGEEALWPPIDSWSTETEQPE